MTPFKLSQVCMNQPILHFVIQTLFLHGLFECCQIWNTDHNEVCPIQSRPQSLTWESVEYRVIAKIDTLVGESLVSFLGLKTTHFIIRQIFGTPCISVSAKSELYKFHFQWILAPMTFKIPKIYVNMLAKFKCYSQCSTVLWFAIGT